MREKVKKRQRKSKYTLDVKNVRQMYCYIFYKQYRFFEDFSYKNPTYEIEASGAMSLLLIFFFLSLCFYTVAIIGYMPYIPTFLFVIIIIVVFAAIYIFNYRMFEKNKEWRQIIKYFRKLPKRTNQVGSLLVFLFNCAIYLNMVLSLYIMSKRLK